MLLIIQHVSGFFSTDELDLRIERTAMNIFQAIRYTVPTRDFLSHPSNAARFVVDGGEPVRSHPKRSEKAGIVYEMVCVRIDRMHKSLETSALWGRLNKSTIAMVAAFAIIGIPKGIHYADA